MSKKKPTLQEFADKVDNSVDDDDVWHIIDQFVANNGISSHQLNSFNDFIYEGIQRAIDPLTKFSITSNEKTYHVEFVNFMFHPPRYTEIDGETHDIFPVECMQRGIAYSSTWTCDVVITPPNIEPTVAKNVLLGNIPVMIKSDLCHTTKIAHDIDKIAEKGEDIFDHGGYFITVPKHGQGITANKHIITFTEKIKDNYAFFYINKKNKEGMNGEIKSIAHNNSHLTCVGLSINHGSKILISMPWIDITNIPLGIMFKALGVTDEETIITMILGSDWINSKYCETVTINLDNTFNITEKKAKLFISNLIKKKAEKNKKGLIEQVERILEYDFLPHLNYCPEGNVENINIKKAIYLAKAIARLLRIYFDDEKEDSRDNIANKLIINCGTLLSQQIYNAFRRLTMDIVKYAKSALDSGKPADILKYINPKIITNSMSSAISANNWGSNKGKQKDGLSQVYDQYNHMAGIANIRKINQTIGDEGNLTKPRELDESHLNVKCPAETPEGKNVGLVGNLALACLISPFTDPLPVIKLIRKTDNFTNIDKIIKKQRWKLLDLTCVLVNGNIQGITKNPMQFVQDLRFSRRNSSFHNTVSISYKDGDRFVNISTTGGRPCQVLFRIENGQLVYNKNHISELQVGSITWENLFEQGVIEIVDKEEEGNYLIAFMPSDLKENETRNGNSPKYTHCYLHPSLMYGVGGSIIPFSNHNQSPRNTYQCLWENEFVKMANGKMKKIKYIHVGDEILTFDPVTLKIFSTRVISHMNNVTDKQILKIVSWYNKSLIVTFDHKIMTSQGWMAAQDLIPHKTKIAIECCSQIIFVPVLAIEPYENVRISDLTTESDTHCFITGSGFCVHNSAMGKQAIGIPFMNYRQIMCGTFNTLMITQRPLALARTSSMVEFDVMPAGQIGIVCIVCDEFNEEDSNSICLSSVDRGFMVSFKWTVYYAEIRKDRRELLMIPPNSKNNVSHLDEDGLISEGATVYEGDILIGKVLHINDKYIDSSIVYSHQWPAVVDRVQIGTTGEGYTYVRVMTVQKRRPVVGDKFAFMPGQKNTVGMLYRQEDMPFTKDGRVPDVLLNSLAIPSRMTIALLIEILVGKVVANDSWLHNTYLNDPEFVDEKFCEKYTHPKYPGIFDATSFRKSVSVYEISQEAKRLGISEFGDEIMYDGRTGRPLRCLVFNGPVFFQRLRHMVVDKVHARARGGITSLTRQPTEGRAAGGGLKMGVMERDCANGQGVAAVVRDRMFEQSDKYSMPICRICGIQIDSVEGDEFAACSLCGTNNAARINIPYGTKLLVQQLMVINDVQRILTS